MPSQNGHHPNSNEGGLSFCYGHNETICLLVLLLTISSLHAICHVSSILEEGSKLAEQCSGFFFPPTHSGLLSKLFLLGTVTVVSDHAEVGNVFIFILYITLQGLWCVVTHNPASSIPEQRWKCFLHYISVRQRQYCHHLLCNSTPFCKWWMYMMDSAANSSFCVKIFLM